ncbi:hypothetical protein ACFY36_00795 [Actinoplanes sp. NPDC000266]
MKPSAVARRYRHRNAEMTCLSALRPPRPLRRWTRFALTSAINVRISDGLIWSIRRSPQRSTARFQYVPYAFSKPAEIDAETMGTYSANVGAVGRTGAPATRSLGEIPMRSNSIRAASTVD